MAESKSRESRTRQSSRIPLTYYRSKGRGKSEESPFQKRQKRTASRGRKLIFGVADLLLVVAVVAGLIYAIIVRPDPTLVTNSEVYHSKEVYTASASKLFAQLKNRNKVSLNQDSVMKELERGFPEIAAGSVELPLFSEKPTVHLNISPPAFRLKSGNEIYIVDEQGVAIATAQQLPKAKNLPTIIDESNFSPNPGKAVISADSVRFIEGLLAQTRRAGVPIKSLSFPPLAQELDLATEDQPYFVKFYLGGDPLVQAGTFLAARHQFSSGVKPSVYLDVRVPGKIFYK